MTKLRTPGSIEEAVTQAKVLLSREAIAAALTVPAAGITVSVSLVDKWCDELAPQRIGLHQALAIEALLIEAGHAPVFTELFARLLPAPPAPPEEKPDPLREAMRATAAAADLMEGVDRAMIDGVIDRGELGRIDGDTHKLQRQLARLRRIVRGAQPAKAGG